MKENLQCILGRHFINMRSLGIEPKSLVLRQEDCVLKLIISAVPWQPAAGQPGPPLPPAYDCRAAQIRTTTDRENDREYAVK